MRRRGVFLVSVAVALSVAMLSKAGLPQGTSNSLGIAEVRALALRDQDHRPFSLSRMLGTVTVLNFVYTGCGGQCPLQTSQLTAVQSALPEAIRSRVQFLSVSVDPEHDLPNALRTFALERGVDLRTWRFLTGGSADIVAIADYFHALSPGDRDPSRIDGHSTIVQLFDAQGQGVMRYGGTPVDEDRLVADLTYLVTHGEDRSTDAR